MSAHAEALWHAAFAALAAIVVYKYRAPVNEEGRTLRAIFATTLAISLVRFGMAIA